MTETELLIRTSSVSKHLVCNENGVLWRDLYRAAKDADARLIAAQRGAIEAWKEYYDLTVKKAKKEKVGRKEVREALDLALDLTRIALD